MIKFDRKMKILTFGSIIAVALLGYFLSNSPAHQRGMASVTEKGKSSILDTANLSWKQTQSGITMKLEGKSKNICDDWSTLRVVFRGEGLAYSGEVDRVMQTADCIDGKFQQNWNKNLTKDQGAKHHKKGVFVEEPPMWVMEQMSVLSSEGYLYLNTEEVRQQYQLVPTLVPQ